jgi:hypothetical protein
MEQMGSAGQCQALKEQPKPRRKSTVAKHKKDYKIVPIEG